MEHRRTILELGFSVILGAVRAIWKNHTPVPSSIDVSEGGCLSSCGVSNWELYELIRVAIPGVALSSGSRENSATRVKSANGLF